MEIFNSIFYFIIVIGILVLIHEFGHFIAARACGIRTDIFSIGLGYRLFGFNKKYGFTFGKLPKEAESNTGSDDNDYYCDYRLSLFPIGGYVKVAGMVDESMDTEFAKTEPKDWEFRSKNTFQKTLVISGGVIMNFLLAIAIFWGISYFEGSYTTDVTTVGYVLPTSLASKSGIKSGDKIVAINGKKVSNWQELRERMTFKQLGKSKVITLSSPEGERTIDIDGKAIINVLKNKGNFEESFGIMPSNMKVLVSDVFTTLPAGIAGMKSGDTILSINGESIDTKFEFINILSKHRNKPVYVQWAHNKTLKGDTLTPNSEGKIGVAIGDVFTGNTVHTSYGFFESAAIGFRQTVDAIELLINSIVQIFKGNVSVKQSLGGPIFIAKNASAQAEQGLGNFLTFTALLSISLAIINILPFPALDGGHIVFIILEGILRREISVKVKMAFQQVGLVLLLILMTFIIYNDFTR